MDAAALLRSYSTALHEKRTVVSLRRASDAFWRKHPLTDAVADAAGIIIAAHRRRIAGRGSPADCDEALAKAIRSLT